MSHPHPQPKHAHQVEAKYWKPNNFPGEPTPIPIRLNGSLNEVVVELPVEEGGYLLVPGWHRSRRIVEVGKIPDLRTLKELQVAVLGP
jgi:hypothetical protein